MRIVAGQAKGHRLIAPKGRDVRPTTDRVREALFSAIGRHVVGAHVLDLFAGSGALGLESLSRGAASATFVEKNRSTVAILSKNIDALDSRESARILARDARDALSQLRKKNRSFDLIFVDPPYRGVLLNQVLETLQKSPLLGQAGVIVAEHPEGAHLSIIKGFHIVSTKRYGKTILSFVQRAQTD